jgi:HD-GYP domain-containing protein (c-di-GMP phosphodiesterase class II)
VKTQAESPPASRSEQLYARGRTRAQIRAEGRERSVEYGMALAFIVVAVAMALVLSSPRSLQATDLILLMAAYVVACRARFDIADGYTVPTELVLVPMLFLLPTPIVPLVVSVSWALGRISDHYTGVVSFRRAFHVFADCWHAVGPALVLVACGAQTFSWGDWPIYALALLAQFGFDFAASALRAWLIDGTSPAAVGRAIAPVYALDAALAPIGLLAAFAALAIGPGIAMLVIPLAAVLAVLSRERQRRVDQAIALSDAYHGTALLLGDMVEADDSYTGSHSRAVVELALGVSDRLGLSLRQRRDIEFAALLHDIGKITVPKEIIHKPGRLSEEEWAVVRRHTIEGERMLKRIGGVLAEVGGIVRSSHEHFDGSGYPDGLAGEQIPVEARIVACCDAFSAMTTNRSYRRAMSVEAALAELRACAGTQFDPRVVAVLVELIERDRV